MPTSPPPPLTVAELRRLLDDAHDDAWVVVVLAPSDILENQKGAEAGLTLAGGFDVDVSDSASIVKLHLRGGRPDPP